jgi:hypothetical protein
MWGKQTAMRLAPALLLLIFGAAAVSGQDVANGLATANVVTELSVVATQPLQFGNVFQGVAKTQDKNDDINSGIFTITGQASAGISISLTLPDFLALTPGGADRMYIAFSATDANLDTTVVTPATFGAGDGWIDQNPRLLPNAAKLGSGGSARIYLGGKVSPAVDQRSGAYAGDIVCSVAYNGS